MIVKKLRLQRNWSQEQLSHYSGLSIRTIQRIERGKTASVESLKSIAAVFEVNFEDLQPEPAMNQQHTNPLISQEETEALEYVKGLKEFYLSVITFLVIIPFLAAINIFITPGYYWIFWVIGGWGLGLILHAVWTFEWFNIFTPEWEKKQVEKKLGRKL